MDTAEDRLGAGHRFAPCSTRKPAAVAGIGRGPVGGEHHLIRGRLHAAKALLDTAVLHGCSLLVASRSGPAGLDACTVMEAAAIRGGPFVHAASPLPWAPPGVPCPGR